MPHNHSRREALEPTKIAETYSFVVPFFDVDSMNIMWHGHYCKYMELARCKLLDKIGYNYRHMKESGYGFPVVDMHIKYIKPLLFEQPVSVTATLEEWEYRLKIGYVFHDTVSQEKLTKAHTIQATVELASHNLRLECPAIFVEKVQQLLV